MNQRLVILGGGESGVGTAILGKKEGYEVFLSDNGEIDKIYKNVLLHHKIDWEENQHSFDRILSADLVVKSPGIRKTENVIQELIRLKIPIISELEFGYRFTQAKIIGVTGSNGKTTVVKWLGYLLKNAGFKYELAGNMGRSFAKSVATESPDFYVLEISSFQLEDIIDFHPHIAVVTNIISDHLDRYDNFQQYVDVKFKIALNQNEEDFFIYDADDKVLKEQLKIKTIKARKIPFSFNSPSGLGSEKIDKQMTTELKNRTSDMTKKDLALKGEHNAKNAMAASTVANLLKIRKQTIRESLESFQGVEHRLENVLKVKNVQYINDSKATNINSTYYALKTVKSKAVWIVGGEDKGNDYSELLPLVNEKVKAIICLGIDNTKVVESFNKCIDPIFETQSMEEAVKLAYKMAERGDSVLLSPACASFDLFEDYQDRGRQFKDAVRNL